MSEVSDFIKLSADEEVIREYKGFKMLKPQSATLTIAVTSKRLILYAMTRKAMKMNRPSLSQDVRIEDIRGVEVYENKKVNRPISTVGILVLLFGIFGCVKPMSGIFYDINMHIGHNYGGPAVVALGILLCIIAAVVGSKRLKLNFQCNKECRTNGMLMNNTEIKWSGESQRVLCELGSLIIDVQEQFITSSAVSQAKAAAGYVTEDGYRSIPNAAAAQNADYGGYPANYANAGYRNDGYAGGYPDYNNGGYAGENAYGNGNAGLEPEDFAAPPRIPKNRAETARMDESDYSTAPAPERDYEEREEERGREDTSRYSDDSYESEVTEEKYEQEPEREEPQEKPVRKTLAQEFAEAGGLDKPRDQIFNGVDLGLMQDADVHLPPKDEEDGAAGDESMSTYEDYYGYEKETAEEDKPKRDDYLF